MAIAGLITLFLFVVMKILITGQDGTLDQIASRTKIEFIRIERDEDINTKNRKPPRPKQKPSAPPPPLTRQKPPPPPSALDKVMPNFNMAMIDGKLSAPSDAEILPLVRVPPQYPTRALNRGIEGWVLLEFTVSKAGTVLSPRVVRSSPPVVFDRAAVRAVTRWKYRPQIINGQPTDRKGVQTVIAFELEK